MIEIKKGTEPEGLKKLSIECKQNGLSARDSYNMLQNPLKKEVLECLRRDQGQLCVYCMSRIPREDRDVGICGETIEHFIPLDPEDGRDVGQALDYMNLFAVCHGNTKMRKKGERRIYSKKDLTCDKHRENKEFRKISPYSPEVINTIFYNMTGEIKSTDPDIEYDLTKTLNLNCASSPIVYERKAVLDEFINNLGKVKDDELFSYCERLLKTYTNENNPKTPYVGVVIWYLKSLISALI